MIKPIVQTMSDFSDIEELTPEIMRMRLKFIIVSDPTIDDLFTFIEAYKEAALRQNDNPVF